MGRLANALPFLKKIKRHRQQQQQSNNSHSNSHSQNNNHSSSDTNKNNNNQISTIREDSALLGAPRQISFLSSIHNNEDDALLVFEEGSPLSGNNNPTPTNYNATNTTSNTKTKSNTKQKRWTGIRQSMQQGDFLLQKVTKADNSDESRDKKLQEIRSGISFSLTQCLSAIGAYLIVTIGCYHFVLEPEWTLLDSCYFAVTTFTTVGYGDEIPTTHASMIFTSVYALTGVACLGIALGVIGSRLLDAQDTVMKRADQLLQGQVLSVFEPSISSSSGTTSTTTTTNPPPPKKQLPPPFEQQEQQQQQQSPPPPEPEQPPQQHNCSNLFSFLPLLILLVGLAFLIGKLQGWDTTETIYYLIVTGTYVMSVRSLVFCFLVSDTYIFIYCIVFISASTVGYGDLTPTTDGAKWVALFFIPLAVGCMGQWLSLVAQWILESRSARFHKHCLQQPLTQADLDIMDHNGDGEVTRAEFLEFMLVAMNKMDAHLVETLREHFDKMDVDGTGILSRQDLVYTARQKLKTPGYKVRLAAYKQQLLQTQTGVTAHNNTQQQQQQGRAQLLQWGDFLGKKNSRSWSFGGNS
jgi:hypothetical protein